MRFTSNRVPALRNYSLRITHTNLSGAGHSDLRGFPGSPSLLFRFGIGEDRGAYGCRVIVIVVDWLGSSTLVALIVMVCGVVMVDGAT